MIIAIEPFFEIETYFSHVTTPKYAVNILTKLEQSNCTDHWQQSNEDAQIYDKLLHKMEYYHHEHHEDFIQYSIIDCEGNITSKDYSDMNKYRVQDYETVTIGNSSLVVYMHHKNYYESLVSIGRTAFVCIVLCIGALLISKDAQDLVLRPLEFIMEKVNKLAEDPFQIFKVDDHEEHLRQEHFKQTTETRHLEEAITKISTLLILGFGEAGSAIVSQSLSQFGELDPMIPGKKITAIFGYCDIL